MYSSIGKALEQTCALIRTIRKKETSYYEKSDYYSSREGINILDISQTIVNGYFNMMMIIDVTEPEKPFGVMADELATLGEEKIGVQIRCQKEEIFDLMHRI